MTKTRSMTVDSEKKRESLKDSLFYAEQEHPPPVPQPLPQEDPVE